MEIEGKNAVIVGGASGFGGATAEALAKRAPAWRCWIGRTATGSAWPGLHRQRHPLQPPGDQQLPRLPGDLDEAIEALLVFRGADDVERQGAGFERVRAFREGVINGAAPCLEYQA